MASTAGSKSHVQSAEAVAAWQSRLNVHRLYLIVALTWGLLLVFVVPPFQAFDEVAHYYRAWSVAQGQLVVPDSGHVRLPEGANDLLDRFPLKYLMGGFHPVRLGSLWDELSSPMGAKSVRSSSFSSEYGPIGYLPQATGLAIARLAGGSPLLALYLARFLSLLASVILTYFGLRFLPFAKLGVCLVALLPMTMMQMASLSPDAMVLGACIFLSGMALRCASKESVSRLDVALLLGGAVVLVNAKPGYALFSLLLLLLLPRQFTSRRAYAATVFGSIIGSCLLAALFAKLAPGSKELLVSTFGPQNGVDPAAQIAHIITHPLSFLQAVTATIGSEGVSLLRQIVGSYAWGNLDISDGVTLIAAVGAGAVLASGETVIFAAWRRAMVLGIAFLTAIAVTLSLYVMWTSVSAPLIGGLQGRYFTPCAVLAFIGLASFPFGRRWLVPLIVAIVIFLLILTNLRTLLHYYY